VLSKADPRDIDLLVLPELAFSGYNFRSLQHISPFLEPTTSGITSLWARTTALKYNCVVTVGYPERVDVTAKWPTGPEYYNSAITVNAEGETIANYRKSFLYYTDERWALEGPDGFFGGEVEGLGNVAMGICKWPTKSFKRMDLNPYKFEAPWEAWEFAHHILRVSANLVILSMAWLTREDRATYSRAPKEPDLETLAYWLARLEPIIRAEAEEEIIVVLANRSGWEEEAVYAGTSTVLGVQSGEVKLYGILGRGERDLLVVDTSHAPQAKLVWSLDPPTSTSRSSAAITSQLENCAASVSTAGTWSLLEAVDDLMTPVSPVDASLSQAFFHTRSTVAESNGLRSSIAQPTFTEPSPHSPTFRRPESPKSRNASRIRQPEEHDPALASHDLSQEPQVHRSKLSSPLQSASIAPEHCQSAAMSNGLGPRARHITPRPRSAFW